MWKYEKDINISVIHITVFLPGKRLRPVGR
jgi:hypothetical protein